MSNGRHLIPVTEVSPSGVASTVCRNSRSPSAPVSETLSEDDPGRGPHGHGPCLTESLAGHLLPDHGRRRGPSPFAPAASGPARSGRRRRGSTQAATRTTSMSWTHAVARVRQGPLGPGSRANPESAARQHHVHKPPADPDHPLPLTAAPPPAHPPGGDFHGSAFWRRWSLLGWLSSWSPRSTPGARCREVDDTPVGARPADTPGNTYLLVGSDARDELTAAGAQGARHRHG